jgi:methanogenic corrinoid protein MtbC1
MAAQLNIAALSRRTGVAPDTIRKWEQRYDILRPTRTPGGQRRYSDLDVERVEWLVARLAEGLRIGVAASLLGVDAEETPSSPTALRNAIVAAVQASDAARVERLVDQTISLLPLERALERVLAPALQRSGDDWAAGRLSVAQEHLLSSAVRSRLERLLADARGPVRGVAVLACAPGERHELGLLMLALLLKADGWQAAYLGADTPFDDALGLARTASASLLCVSATMAESARAVDHHPGDAELGEGLDVLVGGRGASKEVAARFGGRFVEGSLPRIVRSARKAGA